MSKLIVTVEAIRQVTPLIKQFVLVREDGSALPAFSGGSHVVVSMNINGRIHKNPYSLMSSTNDTASYAIAVRLQEQSRGGSVFMHQQVKPGMQLEISYPTNLFQLNKLARKQLLIAGGIGITPFMSQLSELKRARVHYELHYAYRSAEHAAFVEELGQSNGSSVIFYPQSMGRTIELEKLLGKQPLGTHVYVCGPTAMVNDVTRIALSIGWPANSIHSEQFTAPPIGKPISISLAKSGLDIVVPAEMSILETIEAAGIRAPYLCRGGACGQCELEVLEHDGELQHHDHYLSDTEKVSGKKIMPCVSRADCQKLVLNI